MGSIAWYYGDSTGTYYWTESYTMSASGFAVQVSYLIGHHITAADISAASRQADMDWVKRVANRLVYIPGD